MPNSPFNNVLWNKGKMEAKESNQKVAFELAIYIMGDLPEEAEQNLLESYRQLLKNPHVSLPEKLS